MLRLLIVVAIACFSVICHGFGFEDFVKCKADEEFSCIQPCPGETTCSNRDDGLICLAVLQPCLPLCICKDNRLRSDNGTCITNEECNKWKCPGANEHFECGFECDKECASLDGPKNCTIEMWTCEHGCYCDEGYARDADRNCIPIEDCAEDGETTTESALI
ncbi:unnamed protein product [Chrysodeixis includens]|uniref:TIL domain-containing protein n=1 Tax=Chrysodeixis includens TaxID=689277 RepID=A0A9N8KRQ8_CHRIL|nr:unnamed protein product [Chrysodeixis includens]